MEKYINKTKYDLLFCNHNNCLFSYNIFSLIYHFQLKSLKSTTVTVLCVDLEK